MQSVSSRIWTRVAASISYDGNHYTTGTITLRLKIDLVSNPARAEGLVNMTITPRSTWCKAIIIYAFQDVY